jgi:hypothetical protein
LPFGGYSPIMAATFASVLVEAVKALLLFEDLLELFGCQKAGEISVERCRVITFWIDPAKLSANT